MLKKLLLANDPKALKGLGLINIIITVTVIIAVQIGLLFLSKYLWNKYLVDTLTFVRPLKSIVHLIAIILIVRIILY